MSLKTLLMPAISQRLLSRETLRQQRVKAERSRLQQGLRHQVHYFHQVDDPYSALVAAALPHWLARFDVDLVPHVVSPPDDSAAPQRDKLVAYSRKDAQRLAGHLGLAYDDHGAQPSPEAVAQATRALVGAIDGRHFVPAAADLSRALWAKPAVGPAMQPLGAGLTLASQSATTAHVAESNALRLRLGHYLGATFFYGGEWYWGLDRLHHLDARLIELGAQRDGVNQPLFPLTPDLGAKSPPRPAGASPAIDFFFSLRSPYSAIVAPRIFELARSNGARVKLRYLLPMVMRGLPVPRAKRLYISRDAAREAYVHGTPFGRLNDPVGRPTERGLALIPLAEQQGQGQAYILSFMQGVWSQGIDAGSDSGLRKIAERASLDWAAAQAALQDDNWRKAAEKNRTDLFALGLWGVPSFHVGTCAVWGQDRLWAVQDEISKR